jgi:PAT family beta-lactamase induction signal transducer AmpG
VALAILVITALVPFAMKEPVGPPRAFGAGAGVRAVVAELGQFVRHTAAAFTSSRSSFFAIFLALLPMGSYALSFSLQSNLAVELGLSDRQVASLGLASTVLSAGFCILGGWLSDRFGRRRTLAIFIACTTIPTLVLASMLQRFGWIMPVDPQMAHRPIPDPALVSLFWAAALAYSVFQGLMYGVGTAIFMDVTSPRVAATQFTAYMALCNLVYSYTSIWQGHSMQSWGYPTTLVLDAAFGLVSLGILPFMGAIRRAEPAPPGAAVPELAGP